MTNPNELYSPLYPPTPTPMPERFKGDPLAHVSYLGAILDEHEPRPPIERFTIAGNLYPDHKPLFGYGAIDWRRVPYEIRRATILAGRQPDTIANGQGLWLSWGSTTAHSELTVWERDPEHGDLFELCEVSLARITKIDPLDIAATLEEDARQADARGDTDPDRPNYDRIAAHRVRVYGDLAIAQNPASDYLGIPVDGSNEGWLRIHRSKFITTWTDNDWCIGLEVVA